MKWSGGPIVAIARVEGFRQIEHCTPDRLRATTAGYRLHDREDYWRSLQPSFFAVVIYLEDERWLSPAFVPAARSRGASWIVLDRPELEAAWLRPAPETDIPGQGAPDRPPRPHRGTRTVGLTLRFEILRRDNFQCRYCGRRPPDIVLHADHVVPWSSGGPTDLDNLVAACSDCNLGKGARRLAVGR